MVKEEPPSGIVPVEEGDTRVALWRKDDPKAEEGVSPGEETDMSTTSDADDGEDEKETPPIPEASMQDKEGSVINPAPALPNSENCDTSEDQSQPDMSSPEPRGIAAKEDRSLPQTTEAGALIPVAELPGEDQPQTEQSSQEAHPQL